MKKNFRLMFLVFAVLLLTGIQPLAERALALDIVPAGTYTMHLTTDGPNMVMTLQGKELVVENIADNAAHLFIFEQEGNNGFFLIRVANTGLYLDASGPQAQGRTQVIANEYTGQQSQLWYAHKADDNTYVIFSALSSQDEHWNLRSVWKKIVLDSEYSVGKNYFWRLDNMAD